MNWNREEVLKFFGFTDSGIPSHITNELCMNMYYDLKRQAENAQNRGLFRAMHMLTKEAQMYKGLSFYVE